MKLSYGPVMIMSGQHKGKVGYYDDDEGSKAIVYLGVPFQSACIRIKKNYLRKATTHGPSKAWKIKNPEIAKIMGVEAK